MAGYLMFFTLWIGNLTSQPKPVQTPAAVRISGICFDVTTAVYLPVDVFAMLGSATVRLGQSNENGVFDLLLPRSATSVSFASSNYRTVTLPVTFVNKPGNGAKFSFGIIMGRRDSVVVKQTHQLMLSNTLPDSAAITYSVEPTGTNTGLSLVTTAHGNRRPPGGRFTAKKGKKMPITTFEGARPGPYQVIASTASGQVLVNQVFVVRDGLTFMEIRADSPSRPVPAKSDNKTQSSANVMPDSRVVYFEQSRYELNPATKASLDSVSRMLIANQQIIARITGYTDNVGERALNLTLSEYRAKVVASYLKQKGVWETQLLTTWKGGSSLTTRRESEDAKAKNRRVVLDFSPK